jgi:hypothetical protein
MASHTVPPPPAFFHPSPNQVAFAFSVKILSDAAPSGLPSGFGVV